MAIFGIFEPNLALIFGQNASVGSPGPRSAKIAKSAVIRLFWRENAFWSLLEAHFCQKVPILGYFWLFGRILG